MTGAHALVRSHSRVRCIRASSVLNSREQGQKRGGILCPLFPAPLLMERLVDASQRRCAATDIDCALALDSATDVAVVADGIGQ